MTAETLTLAAENGTATPAGLDSSSPLAVRGMTVSYGEKPALFSVDATFPAGAMSAIVGLRAIPVVLIGGMDSIGGALIGGIIVGVCESLAGAYIEPMGLIGFKDVAPYLLLLIVLLIRPYGLFGEVRIERV